MYTIYDIAEKSGYSPATVSKVLNNYENVSQMAKDKILAVSKELNYIPNASARGLMTKRSNVIGLVVYEDIYNAMTHQHFSVIFNAFKNYVESRGYDVLFVNTKAQNNIQTYYEHCKYRSLDGVLISIGDIQLDEPRRQISELVESDLPKVSVESVYNDVTTVLCDNYQGTYKLMEYLHFLGHTKIAFIDAKFGGTPSDKRFKAYKDFLEENNIEYNNTLVYTANGFERSNGVEVAKQIIRNGFSKLPTAIVCICDEIAIGLMKHFKANGINVPDDVSIVGFDDIEVAKYVGLTTIRQDRKLIGEIAGERLLRAIEGIEQAELVEVETELIIRNTCKSIK